ncbi:hypothetical protein [Parasitella parasitica]|uniref:DUF4460 domain-containing protein n=1 Tax=Parasitella parasitica TaxID=35722 RepID=A0A0B7NJD3_9FUNG|nr:hypothetical protein [Parasitella parasitica]
MERRQNKSTKNTRILHGRSIMCDVPLRTSHCKQASFFFTTWTMTNKILKPYLRKFILQTHPDFFHHDKLRKTTNAASLQSLYDILQPSTPSTSKQPNSAIRLEFFIKGQKKKDGNAISSVFHSQDSDWDKAASFLDLCQRVNIPVVPTDLDIVQDMVNKQSNRNNPPYKYKSLTREFAERLYKEQSATVSRQHWTENDVLNQSLIMFDTPVNRKLTASRLSRWLPKLQPQLWWGKIPMLIISSTSHQPPTELTKGMLVIQDGMELEGSYATISPLD